MTRTERATHPRAILRDRSENKTGLNKDIKKAGGGGHSWGSLKDELDHEYGGEEDEFGEVEDDAREDGVPKVGPFDKKAEKARRESVSTASAEEEEDRAKAREVRTGMRKNGDPLDLDAIARTSNAVSGSPPRTRNEAVPVTISSDAHTAVNSEF